MKTVLNEWVFFSYLFREMKNGFNQIATITLRTINGGFSIFEYLYDFRSEECNGMSKVSANHSFELMTTNMPSHMPSDRKKNNIYKYNKSQFFFVTAREKFDHLQQSLEWSQINVTFSFLYMFILFVWWFFLQIHFLLMFLSLRE